MSGTVIKRRILNLIDEFNKAKEKAAACSQKSDYKWKTPPMGMIMLMGLWTKEMELVELESSYGTTMGLFWLLKSSTYHMPWIFFVVEALSMFVAIEFASELGLKEVQMEGGCTINY